MEKVRQDKLREVTIGHDGTWVAHPGLVSLAMDIFNEKMPAPNQISRQRDDFTCTAADLLAAPKDSITEGGLRHNINVGILYIESWLRGVGAVAIDNLMEDAATAEISRSQVWQWIHQNTVTAEGNQITHDRVEQLLADIVAAFPRHEGDRLDDAAEVFRTVALQEEFPAFLTISAYTRFLVEEIATVR